MPTHLVAKVEPLAPAASLTLEMIRELDRFASRPGTQHYSRKPNGQSACTIRGIGVNFAPS